MQGRLIPILVGALVLSLGLLWALSRAKGVTPPDPSDASPVSRRVFEVAPTALMRPPEPEGQQEAAPQGPTALAHQDIAAALGLVGIRCHVGAELDTRDLGGSYNQRIEGGWYSDVVVSLEGNQEIARRFPRDATDDPWAVDLETLFFVSWKAETPGQTVPCEVSWPLYAELRVRVIDTSGRPVADARVFGCGKQGKSDENGRLTLDGHAERACGLIGMTVAYPLLIGNASVPPLDEHEVREVDLTLEDLRPGEPPPPADRPQRLIRWPPTETDQLREIYVFTRLRAEADDSRAELYDSLIENRRENLEIARARAAFEARIAELQAFVDEGQADEDVLERGQRLLDALRRPRTSGTSP